MNIIKQISVSIAIFDKTLNRVVLIEKKHPAWQAGFANFPGGIVTNEDYDMPGWGRRDDTDAIRHCINRKIRKETGMRSYNEKAAPFCTLQTNQMISFFATVGDVDEAKTTSEECVKIVSIEDIVTIDKAVKIPTVPDLPWLVAMALQKLRLPEAPVYKIEEIIHG